MKLERCERLKFGSRIGIDKTGEMKDLKSGIWNLKFGIGEFFWT